MFRPGSWSYARYRLLSEWVLPTQPEHAPGSLRRIWLIAVYTLRRWWTTDRCSSLASSLALQTLLSVVPTVGVLMFIISLTGETSQYEVIEPIARALSPDDARAEAIAHWVVDLGRNVNFTELGGVGFMGVLVLAYLLFSTLERTVNSLWRVSKTRNMVSKFTMFFTMSVLTPIIMVISLAEPVIDSMIDLPVAPVLTTSIALVAINGWLPNQKVGFRAAMMGGLISAALFELGKFGFGWYLKAYAVTTYEGLYGSLAILPVFVVWSYVSWMIVLLGVEVAWVIHHMPFVAREGYVHPKDRSRDQFHSAPGRTAARLLLTIGDNYSRRHTGTSVDDLNERFDLGLATIIALTDRMARAGLVTLLEKGGYIPARPLEQISLQEVLHMFDGGDVLSARDDTLGSIFANLDSLQEGEIGKLAFDDLVAIEAERAGSPSLRRSRAKIAEDAAEVAEADEPDADDAPGKADEPDLDSDGVVRLHTPKKS